MGSTMPLSWNEIKSRSIAFSKQWENECSEDAEAKSFWDGFFNVFGITRKRMANFEAPVKKLGDKLGFIDLFWKGMLLVEHKSRGKNLERAYEQAMDYFPGINERDLPQYVLVSDFERFHLYDLEKKKDYEFELKDLHNNVLLFGFIAGYQTHEIHEQDPVNIHAAERMGKLHDLMKESGYKGHQLELYLVRLLFCLFADDTGIFQRQQFQEYIEQRTNEDGSDLAHHISTLFQVLNTQENSRLKNLDEQLEAFPYINGKLFDELLPTAGFDSTMRNAFLDCCALDWGRISPAIFGSLFQSIMDKKERRNLGAHYTSEKNILKLIKPLFLDALRDEFDKVKKNKNRLLDFHNKLRSLKFLDPACGCGNFLVIAYRELRLLELELLRTIYTSKQLVLDVSHLVLLNVDQFYGIEIEEFPSQIAQVALWLMDHQMNLMVSVEFGLYFSRIPLSTSGAIVCGNALRIGWNDVVPVEQLNYIMGNPPFVGSKFMNDHQRQDVALVFGGVKNAGLLDFVAAWYVKAARMIQKSDIRCAFVSTNSITQGEQVGVLWSWMLVQGVKIFFAHRTFRWDNEARGKAAVHCVIIGFAVVDIAPKWLFEYEDIKGDPHKAQVKNINPYLVDASDMVLVNRKRPVCNIQELSFGNMPNDGGNLLLNEAEKMLFLNSEPIAEKFVRQFIGSEEFINKIPRWCIWLVDVDPHKLKEMPLVLERILKVKEHRLKSSRETTRKLASAPAYFGEIRQPRQNYIAVPKTSSERRQYIPIGLISPEVIASTEIFTIDNGNLFVLGVLSSLIHMAWVRAVCGRLKNDYRYSASIVYNNFPWPENPSDKHRQAIETKAQTVLDARTQFPDASLADLYDPLTMPPVLLKAHKELDKAVDTAYGQKNFNTEAERVAFLFELYQKYTN
jgi:hypothetical protein